MSVGEAQRCTWYSGRPLAWPLARCIYTHTTLVEKTLVLDSTSKDLLSMMQAGLSAPSADNDHCFSFKTSAAGISLIGRNDYVSAPFHRRVLNGISLGAVVENMVIRAARLGYRAQPDWAPDPLRPSLIAELRLTQGEPSEGGLDDAIQARHTNRSVVFRGPGLAKADLAEFAALIDDIPGVTLTFVDAGWQRRTLLHLVRLAEAERFKVRSLHDDLFSAVRFELGWKVSADKGLPPKGLMFFFGMGGNASIVATRSEPTS